jgi:ribosomal protein L32
MIIQCFAQYLRIGVVKAAGNEIVCGIEGLVKRPNQIAAKCGYVTGQLLN